MKRAFLIGVLVSLSVATARAQLQIPWQTIDGGGGMSSSGGPYEVAGTIGQPDAQTPPVMSGGTLELTGGFWPVANACYCLGDMNSDGQRNGLDIQQFLDCILSGGNCSCADVDQANGVTVDDVNAFASDLLNSSACP